MKQEKKPVEHHIKDMEMNILSLEEVVTSLRTLVRDRELQERITIQTKWEDTKDKTLSDEDKRSLIVSQTLSTDPTYIFNKTMLAQKSRDLAILYIERDYLQREFRRSHPWKFT